MKTDVTFHPSWWNSKIGIDFSRDFFFNPEKRIPADQEMRRELHRLFGAFGLGDENPQARPVWGTDLLASGFLYSALLGCDIRYGADIPPEVISPKLTADQMKDFKLPDLDAHPLWQEAMADVEYLKKKYGHVISAINLQGVLNLALDLRGEEVMMDFYMNPEDTSAFIGKLTDFSLDVGKRIKSFSDVMSGGVTAIVNFLPGIKGVYVHSNCSVEMVSNDTYEEFLLDADNRLSDVFQPYGIHHCGASMEHVADGYAKVRNLSFAEIGAGSDIAAVRKALPGVHLNLRYSPVRLAKISTAELEKELKTMAEAAGEGPVSMSCVGIDTSVSDEQVSNYLEISSRL